MGENGNSKGKVLFTAHVDSHILLFHIPFLKLFKERGYEVHVATNGDEKIPYCDKKWKVSFEKSPYKLNNLKAIKELSKIIKNEHYDIIHTHTPMGSVITRIAARGARKKGTRVLYTAHGLHFFKGASIVNWLIFYPVEKILSKITDTLILINKEDYDLVKKKFYCKDVRYIPGIGIDENKFNFDMSKEEEYILKRSLGLLDDDYVMIYPAELSKRKRQIWLINAIKDLLKENNKMHLLLPGKDSLNGKCQKLVTELGLSKQIHFLGFRNDIPKLLKISDLALSAAMQEGLPVNILEAMYLGLPIVATDCRGNRDLVKDGVNGYLIALNDKERFAERIKKIYLSKDNYRSFGLNSQIMIKDYSLEKVIDKLSNIYFKNEKMGDGKMKKYRIGYTQGTYDLFHIGHLNLLEHAKEQCDYLIVGVNTERLVREYKNKQPIISENDRARIVSEIKYVDKVLLTDTLDKIEIAKEIKPDAIFIGDDWKNNERWIKTKEDMKKMGIDVVFLPHTDGISTTKIVAKIGGAS